MRYENQLTVANGDFVMLHGRFSGLGVGIPSWVAVDIVRMENGLLAEHCKRLAKSPLSTPGLVETYAQLKR